MRTRRVFDMCPTAFALTLAALCAAPTLAKPGTPQPHTKGGTSMKTATPMYKGELIFTPEHRHNHGSCVVEMPGGGLFTCWYRGSGERTADDVAIMGSRLTKGSHIWEKEMVISDTPGFPDTNPCIWVDPLKRLWLMHSTILNNQWESAITRVKISSSFSKPGTAVKWDKSDLMLLKPGPEFSEALVRDIPGVWEPVLQKAEPARAAKVRILMAGVLAKAKDKLAMRLGWMTRAHPTLIQLKGGGQRLLVPLYSDFYDISLVGYTDDLGETWQVSAPIISQSGVQPSILQRKDGTLLAFMRDNGPPPQRVQLSESSDEGKTWSIAHDIELPDPGAGVEAIILKSGRWLMLNNDTEDGRHSLAISVSEDEGRTWLYKKWVEHDTDPKTFGSYSYPSIIQAKDGSIHMSYSISMRKSSASEPSSGESIKHVEINEAWILDPNGRQPIQAK